jgi:hypothetical protein
MYEELTLNITQNVSREMWEECMAFEEARKAKRTLILTIKSPTGEEFTAKCPVTKGGWW